MGVKGFPSLLQKICPELLRTLPNGLADLTGKTVAIDGTLVTQRMYFAPIPHINRHVLGWYRLLLDLKIADVYAVCVFDGGERSVAKQREVERRRQGRRMNEARRAVEAQRNKRLDQLIALSSKCQSLSQPERRVTQALLNAHLEEHARLRKIVQLSDSSDASNLNNLRHSPGAASPLPSPESIKEDSKPISGNSSARPTHTGHERNEESILDATTATRHGLSDEALVRPESPEFADHPQSNTTSSSYGSNMSNVLESRNSSAETSDARNDASANLHAYNESYAEVPQLREAETTLAHDHLSMHATMTRADVNQALDPRYPVNQEPPGYGFGSNENPHGACFTADRHVPTPPVSNASLPTSSPLALSDRLMPSLSDHSVSEDGASRNLVNIARSLAVLFQTYESCRSTLEKLSNPPSLEADQVDTGNLADEDALPVDQSFLMSRSQHELVEEEGRIWQDLLDPSDEPSDALSKILALEHRSSVILRSYERRRAPSRTTYEDAKTMLRAMGVPYIDCPPQVEGEALAASLVKQGLADYVASEDMDVVVYEAPMLRNFGSRSMPLVEVDGSEVRRALQLPRSSFVDFALLLGTDFSRRLKRIGPVNALKLIKEFESIEKLIDDPKYTDRLPSEGRTEYMGEVQAGREIFQSLPAVSDEMRDIIKSIGWDDWDEERIRDTLASFGLLRAAKIEWDYANALTGNFDDIAPAAFQDSSFDHPLEDHFPGTVLGHWSWEDQIRHQES
ncbi:PIN domain-like protein [Sistotremastrum suecicum HHB10207 ss-3]|uniref:Exonuclease 1 n=1 Tax=Sistotremastrum suecicum HHB10207 ss-3 TaxID=1314776 RepID=A0A165ZKZ7_9AGAM|nr:PIN domain-like protein [Sistotremastrum suecicum HHB10207 ss-3]